MRDIFPTLAFLYVLSIVPTRGDIACSAFLPVENTHRRSGFLGGMENVGECTNFSTAFGHVSLILHPNEHLITTKHMVFL